MGAKRRLERKIDKLTRKATEAGLVKPGNVFAAHMFHDNDCRSIATQSLGDCTCEPEVEFEQLGGE